MEGGEGGRHCGGVDRFGCEWFGLEVCCMGVVVYSKEELKWFRAQTFRLRRNGYLPGKRLTCECDLFEKSP